MTPPRPGRPARGTESGRPLMVAFDLLGRRWALRILWELREETLGFRELQRRCGDMSSSVLRDRLTDLTGAGLVVTGETGYALSEHGRRLLSALARLVANLEDLIAGEAAEPAGVETTLLHDMEKSIAARASDHVMLDVMRIGGVSGWLRGAALADAAGLPASSHTFPELSASLLAVTPTCHRLEWLDHAGPR